MLVKKVEKCRKSPNKKFLGEIFLESLHTRKKVKPKFEYLYTANEIFKSQKCVASLCFGPLKKNKKKHAASVYPNFFLPKTRVLGCFFGVFVICGETTNGKKGSDLHLK